MITKKLYFPIFILILLCLSAIVSCNKKTVKKTEAKNDSQYNTFIDNAEKYSAKQNYDSAFYYYNKAKSICEIPQDNNKIIYAFLNLAIIQQDQGDFTGTETSATEAISFFDSSTKAYYKCAIFNLLANNYQRLYDYENAVYYYRLSLKLADDELQKTILKNNIAVVYLEQQNYQRAISILLPLTFKKGTTENKENYARILDNLGYSYFRLKNLKSLHFLNQSLQIRDSIKDNIGLTKSYIHLSEFYKSKDQQLSYRYSRQAYDKATETNNVDDRLKSLTLLIQNSVGTDYKKHTETYLRINDSLTQARQKAKNQFAKIKYDSTEEKNENLKLKAQKTENLLQLEQQKNGNYVLSFLIFIGFISASFVFYYLKKERQKAIYESETRMAKKLHDELANDVYQTMTFAETQDLQDPIKKETLLGNLDKIYARTRNISRESSKIETGTTFGEELKEMISAYSSDQIQVIIRDNGDINWLKIQSEKKIALHRVLQELMVNMKKHSQCSLAVVSFESTSKCIEINYSDNGIGIDSAVILKNGLHNVENRIHAIKGTITFDKQTNTGFKVKITIPK
ncbi:tetratricopeptide repeat-containing sensor histidine kinase [Flavobacterium sp. N3904]|uniref:tetratricopeptide repeat-containing sensor histidine kinase n=1 Tax=Flavobacterium sp. N3904 TaxID=2986835 RepID=UPI002225A5E2|nr:tetratricopeptide repeat-containing sensor histidine kinase [Flavobacterium sp. N3904]